MHLCCAARFARKKGEVRAEDFLPARRSLGAGGEGGFFKDRSSDSAILSSVCASSIHSRRGSSQCAAFRSNLKIVSSSDLFSSPSVFERRGHEPPRSRGAEAPSRAFCNSKMTIREAS
jgi:hypothetical protein